MTTWDPRTNELFLKAVELHSTQERQEHLDVACAGDTQLRAEVEALLEASVRAGSFLESPAAPADLISALGAPSLTEQPGTMIGPYKLLEQIGEGGMGVVYVAEQQKPVRRRVALKIIKPRIHSRQAIAPSE